MLFRTPLLLGLVSVYAHLSSCLDFDHDPLQVTFDDHLGGTAEQTPRIAIIGAGAGGTSTAYHLARLAGNLGENVSITIFEKNWYVGGRSTTVNVLDDPQYPVELGASIFVPSNRIMVQAAKDLGLQTSDRRTSDDDDDDDIGMYSVCPITADRRWDGTQFVYIQSGKSNQIWNIVKLIRKYGWAPVKSWNLASAANKMFAKMYDEPIFPYTDLTNTSDTLGLTDITKLPADEYLKQKGLGDAFAQDFIQAATRVNYAQNLDGIHALEALVSLYGTRGGTSVIGGNWKIFNEMIIASGAKLHLNTPVLSIEQVHTEGEKRIIWKVGYSEEHDAGLSRYREEIFDAVVIASPFQQSNLTITPSLSTPIPDVSYMTLHVTLLATKAGLNCALFNLSQDTCPTVVMTTLPPNPVDAPIFNSISRGFRLPTGQSAWKIFSPEAFKDEILEEFFPGEPVDWVYRKEWKAFPRLDPIERFAPIELVPDLDSYGLWYTSGIESFISTMETSALSGRNIAALTAQRIFGKHTPP